MSLYNPDDRTAVLAADDLLRVLIEDRKEPKDRPSWNDAWSQVTKGQINAVLETRAGCAAGSTRERSSRERSHLCWRKSGLTRRALMWIGNSRQTFWPPSASQKTSNPSWKPYRPS